MTKINHITLIGCGFTGTSAFYQLVERYPISEITIFEASGDFGPGLPYKTDECDDYLLNNTNDTLCLTPDNRQAFYNWLLSKPELPDGVELPEIHPRGNISRIYYGYFLKDVFRSTLTTAAIKGIKVNLISKEATAIFEEGDKVIIKYDTEEIHCDKVIMCTGHCPTIDRYEHPPEGSNALYFPDHLNTDALDHIPMNAECYILGASLSAFDVVGRLFSSATGCSFEYNDDGELIFNAENNDRSVVLCSRSGRLKKMKSRVTKDINRKYFTLDYLTSIKKDEYLSLNDIADAIKKDCELHHGESDWEEIAAPYRNCTSAKDVDACAADILEKDLRTAVDGTARNILVDIFGDAGLELWDMFAAKLVSPEDEIKYRNQYETAALTYEASCPISTAEKLLALYKVGRLRTIKGSSDVIFDQENDHYVIHHDFGCDKTNVLINTTGSVSRDVTSDDQSALIKHMVNNEMMHPYMCGDTQMPGIEFDMDTFKVTGCENIYLSSQLLWGKGFYTSGAIYMATFVDRILKSIFNKQKS
ncbi:FAD/NAD(P)-binding protein [Pseudemcibacter aquimaris]|uniref:FAD/NAD(P)-binding protein n=1 Tax=Pseudemcibacter aquimaris TaxID=2857064 RepID=UPI002012B118|nr:FAD/NAD(P)-binding protein [Pseudemcibacter aquimaris]MCC3861216.1 FAD/NAD(P)-binding protein [Pseudemcibacter aquimaris]WDU57991.1 FAD/NAD(P)-binding protein [Pseudemcibacter aquimaris]